MSGLLLRVVIHHAAFDPKRRAGLVRVLEGLDRNLVDVIVHEEKERRGSLPGNLEFLSAALKTDATHTVVLPDDALLPKHFTPALLAAVHARPHDILCFQANHTKANEALEAGHAWYTTTDGFTNFGGTYPRELLEEYLDWRRNLSEPTHDAKQHWQGANGDEAVNLWCMATGRKIYKALPGLVGHDLDAPSLDGHQRQTTLKEVHRDNVTPRVTDAEPFADAMYWSTEAVDMGPTYVGEHWKLATKVQGKTARLAYAIEHRNARRRLGLPELTEKETAS